MTCLETDLRSATYHYYDRAIFVRHLVNLKSFAGKAGKVDSSYPSHIHQKRFAQSSLIDTRTYFMVNINIENWR